MPDYDNMSLNDIFKLDAGERLQTLNRLILALEKEPANAALYDDAMREAHSLKAAARIVNHSEVQFVAHRIEELLEILKKGEKSLNPDYIDLFLYCIDSVPEMVNAFVEGRQHGINVDGMNARLDAARRGEFLKSAGQSQETDKKPVPDAVNHAPPAGAKLRRPEGGDSSKRRATIEKVMVSRETGDPTIRIGIERLNKLMNLSGEIYTSTLQFKRQHKNLKTILHEVEDWAASLNLLKDLFREENLASARLEAWLVKAEEDLHRFTKYVGPYEEAVEMFSVNFERLGAELQSDVMRSRMISVAAVFDPQVRFVRDQARESGKKIRLHLEGAETEVDKNILEILKDPLTHLVRNACDHGIEMPDIRHSNGKEEEGLISLKAFHQADRIVLIVEDNGRGMNPEKIKAVAVAKGFLEEARAAECSREEILDLVFIPGFTTATEVTAISGRGVGLDVVRTGLSKVGGRVQLETEPGKFTRFILSLPLTLAVTKTLLIQVGGEIFCFPVTRLEEVTTIAKSRIQTAEGREMIEIKGEIIPLVLLSALWQMENIPLNEDGNAVVVMGQGREKVALLVEKFLDEKEVVSKGLDTRLGAVPDISGATILENGDVAFIVDTDSLLRSCADYTGRAVVSRTDEIAKFRRKKVLVVEDSLTVRELEKKVLENYGYDVMAAVDGLDGFNKAREFKPDIIVTDIEMPHMNGFELISLLKKDKLLCEVPTIIVSFREREEDKRKGMEVGADLYLTKSQYDNKTLLEGIARLIGS